MNKNATHPAPVTGSKSLQQLEKLLNKKEYIQSSVYILTDSNTLTHCLPFFESEVSRAREAEIIEIPAGEDSKEVDICRGIWQSLLELGADRDSVLLNLGGGTVTDIGGFAASTYMRGIRYMNIPTSLMGMADAGMGGKTGLDLGLYKNIIGTFSMPSGVFIHPDFLITLPEKQLRSGFAEIIKYALIADEDLWKTVIKKSYAEISAWSPLLKRCADIKMSVVNEDPMESGIRKVLNFGHTIGHALESYSLMHDKKPMTHGEAVAVGLICESWLSWRMCGMPESLLGEISDVILENFPHKKINALPESLLPLLQADKKNKGGEIRSTLISGIGRVYINQVCDPALIHESIDYYNRIKI